MVLDFLKIKNEKKNTYISIYEGIKQAVEMGVIKTGEKLPSIREAAAQLGVSRTTIENAYIKLCMEGTAESFPQRGYYICSVSNVGFKNDLKKSYLNTVKYDFSGKSIDKSAADTNLWKKTVREVLRDTDELISYGDPQGEIGLRKALAAYSYKARGVRTNAENIVIGAGVGPLLNLLCGLMGRENFVGIENGGFIQAEQIFNDYGIKTIPLTSDKNGVIIENLEKNKANILFLMPSLLSKINVTGLWTRRGDITEWVNKGDRLVIEDDYNGELRITARGVTAFQGKCPERTVYIGSFSKLLLPSIRIAFMVLPDFLLEEFNKRKKYYNQTCGKIEQLALSNYVESGALEKHLRRLRKLYFLKSQNFCSALENVFEGDEYELFESSLSVKLKTKSSLGSGEICQKALEKGIKVLPCENIGEIRLCFAGIKAEEFLLALKILKECI